MYVLLETLYADRKNSLCAESPKRNLTQYGLWTAPNSTSPSIRRLKVVSKRQLTHLKEFESKNFFNNVRKYCIIKQRRGFVCPSVNLSVVHALAQTKKADRYNRKDFLESFKAIFSKIHQGFLK